MQNITETLVLTVWRNKKCKTEDGDGQNWEAWNHLRKKNETGLKVYEAILIDKLLKFNNVLPNCIQMKL
jgi:hypothetical protein